MDAWKHLLSFYVYTNDMYSQYACVYIYMHICPYMILRLHIFEAFIFL